MPSPMSNIGRGLLSLCHLVIPRPFRSRGLSPYRVRTNQHLRRDECWRTEVHQDRQAPPHSAQLDRGLDRAAREGAGSGPVRGAQGANALKTLIAMPYVLDGKSGVVEIDSLGTLHRIAFSADPIRQVPVIQLDRGDGLVTAPASPSGGRLQLAQCSSRRSADLYKSPRTSSG